MATYQKVIVHPLVLLSVTDHFDRSGKTARKRVLGTLLGTRLDDDTVEVTNCYGVPFEEDRKDKSVWFVDYRYHERMNKMFSKVNEITKVYRRYTASPVLIVVNPAAVARDETLKAFGLVCDGETCALAPIASSLSCSDPEGIGISQLLRDARDKPLTSTQNGIIEKKSAIKSLAEKIRFIASYLEETEKKRSAVADGKIIFLIQELLNKLACTLKSEEDNDALNHYNQELGLICHTAAFAKSVVSFSAAVEEIEKKASEPKEAAAVAPPSKSGNVSSEQPKKPERESESEMDDEELAEQLIMEDDIL